MQKMMEKKYEGSKHIGMFLQTKQKKIHKIFCQLKLYILSKLIGKSVIAIFR